MIWHSIIDIYIAYLLLSSTYFSLNVHNNRQMIECFLNNQFQLLLIRGDTTDFPQAITQM